MGLSCSKARGVFLEERLNSGPAAFAGRVFTAGPAGKPGGQSRNRWTASVLNEQKQVKQPDEGTASHITGGVSNHLILFQS